MTIEEKKRRAKANLVSGLKPDYEYKSGLVLELDGSVFRGGSRHHIWVQPVGVDASPVVVFSQLSLTDVQAGWEVIYQQSPEPPEVWQLVRINKALYAQQIDQLNTFPDPSIPQHAREHEIRADHVGTQPIIVYDRMIARFNVQPTSPPSMRVQILPGAYTGLTYHQFITSIKLSEDMTARIPSTSNMARLVGIGLDRDGNFTYANGAEFSKSEEFPPKTAFPDVSNQDDLIGTLYFEQGMTSITNANFKFFYSNVGGGAGRIADIPYRIAGAIGDGGAASQPTTADSITVTDDIQFKQNLLIGGVDGDTPVATLNIIDITSAAQTDFTQKVTSSGFLIEGDYTSGHYMSGVFWRNGDNNNTRPKGGIFLQTGATASKMFLGTSNAYATGITNDGIVIDGDGNVGLSEVDPIDILHIKGADPRIVVQDTETGSTNTNARIVFSDSDGSGDTEAAFQIGMITRNFKIQFSMDDNNGAGSFTDLVTVDDNGQVGIGITLPTAMLDIDQSSTTGAIPVLRLDQADLSEEFIRFSTTVGAGNPINTTALGSYYGRVRVHVEGVGDKWLALYD